MPRTIARQVAARLTPGAIGTDEDARYRQRLLHRLAVAISYNQDGQRFRFNDGSSILVTAHAWYVEGGEVE